MKAKAFGLTFGFFYVQVAFAGLFGPGNFEECVLDKMKGQAQGLMGMASAACLISFPREVVIDHSRLKYTWCKSKYNEAACIDQIPTNVTITRVEGLFFEDACDANPQSKAGVTAIAEKPWYGTTYKFELSAVAKRGCAYFTFYGIERK